MTETTAWDQDGAGGDETEVVEPLTQAEPGFVWSDEPAEVEPEEPAEAKPKTVTRKTMNVLHHTWSHTWARATGILAALLVTASVVGGSDLLADAPRGAADHQRADQRAHSEAHQHGDGDSAPSARSCTAAEDGPASAAGNAGR